MKFQSFNRTHLYKASYLSAQVCFNSGYRILHLDLIMCLRCRCGGDCRISHACTCSLLAGNVGTQLVLEIAQAFPTRIRFFFFFDVEIPSINAHPQTPTCTMTTQSSPMPSPSNKLNASGESGGKQALNMATLLRTNATPTF